MNRFLSSLGALLLSCGIALGQAISSTGTIASNQVPIFTDAKHVMGSTNMTYDPAANIFYVPSIQLSSLSGPTLAGVSVASGPLEPVSLGPGMQYLTGPFRIDPYWNGISTGTNGNPNMGLKGLVMTGVEQRSMSYSSGVNLNVDWNGTPVQRFNQTGNSTVTFSNKPTLTNGVPHLTVVITNTGSFTTIFSDTAFQWLTGNAPTMLPNRVHIFELYWINDTIWADFKGPATPIIPATDTVSGALAFDTGATPVWVDGSQGFLWQEEFILNELNSVGQNYATFIGGTGAAGNGSSATNLYGALQLQAPAVNDHSARRSSPTIYLGDGVWWYETRLAIERVPTGAQDSRIMAGLATYKAGAWFGTTNGAWWQASSTNANWVMAVATNGVVSVTATTTNLVINTPIWLGVLTSNLNSTAYFYIGPTKQIMRTNRVGTISGVGMGNLSFGHAAGVQNTKVNGSGTDNRVDIYHQATMHRPSTPY